MSEIKYPRTDMTQERWREQALCQYENPLMFFPESRYAQDYKIAIAICQTCPVRSECLQHAMDNHERYGVWGGQLFQKKWGKE
jgi:WhiB family redox-sensing transcriptional regulator